MTRNLFLALVLGALSGCHGSTAGSAGGRTNPEPTRDTVRTPSFSAERYCQGTLPQNHVLVVPKEAPVWETNEHSISSLTFSHPSYHKGQVILGSTETVFQMDMSADLASRDVPGSTESCSRVGVKVVVSMRSHVVNIAHELKPGTCAYEKVREHEYRHVRVNQETLYNAAAVLQQEMKQFFGQRVFYGDPAKLRQELKVALDSHWMPRLQELKAAGLVEHEAIDTEDEYDSINTDCDGEIPALLQSDGSLQSLLEPESLRSSE